MIKIAHRGNFAGPNPLKENKPSYILEALSYGYDVEVDIWKIGDKLYLGHDMNIQAKEVSFLFLERNKNKLWIHCKNSLASSFFSEVYRMTPNSNENFNFFAHENEPYTVTSKGYIWSHSESIYAPINSIINYNKPQKLERPNMFGLCSDYIGQYD